MTAYHHSLALLLEVYAYHHAFKLAKQATGLDPGSLFLLEMLKERRELNVAYLFDHHEKLKQLEKTYGISLLSNAYEEELLANYIMDLEAKVRTADIIDFVRAVSPILYRLFLRLAQTKVTDLSDLIHNTRSSQYDTWKFSVMKDSKNPFIQSFLSQKREAKVTSKSLADLIQVTDYSQSIKDSVLQLRQFEKAVRNPLAHLIKPFDEEELHRTTGFSSQVFLEQIIFLAQQTGVTYETDAFYFDSINHIITADLAK